VYWNESNRRFENADEVGYYRSGPPDNAFGDALNDSFGARTIAYNVIVYYQDGSGQPRRRRMVYQGEPSDHAVSASRILSLTDTDNLSASDTTQLQNSGTFYAPDSAPGEPLYNVVRVEVIAWRI